MIRAHILGRSTLIVGLGLVATLVFGTPPAFAHDSIEEALARGAGPPDWVYTVGGWAALGAMLAAVIFAAYRRRGARPLPRHWMWVTQLLAAWVLLGFLQAGSARVTGMPTSLSFLGFLLFPPAIFVVWAFVASNFRGTLRRVLAQRRYRWVAIGTAVVFAGFYLWAGNLVAPPEPDDLPPPGTGTEAFVDFAPVFGPLTTWPAVQVWIPQLPLFGALSVGTVVVVATVAALMGLGWATALYSFNLRRHARRAQGTKMGGLASFSTVGANFCCCCTPAAYPVLALVLGPTAASSAATWMLGTSSPFYSLGMAGMIGLMLAMLSSLRRHLDQTPTPSSGVACEAPELARSAHPDQPQGTGGTTHPEPEPVARQ